MDWEFFILDGIQTNIRTEALDFIMKSISFMGKLSLIWIIIAVVSLCFKKTRGFGITLSADLIMNLLLGNVIIKKIVQRPRPCWMNNTVELIVSMPKDTSFPSGHTMFAFGAATIIFLYNKWLGIAAYIFAILMGFSRMYLYVHFPTDVLFGGLFGIVFAIAVYYLEKILFRPDKPRLVIDNRKALR